MGTVPTMDKHRLRARVYGALGRLTRPTRTALASPVFVIGTGRSGTTLLVQILQSHRDIVSYPSEANELWHPEAFPYDRRTIDLPPILLDPVEFTRRSLQQWSPAREAAIRRTLTGFMRVWGRGKRLLLKSAMVSFMVEQLLGLFPDARFVHIYRSGPSVVSSLVQKEWRKHRAQIGELDFRLRCAHYWNRCVTEVDRLDRALALAARGQLFECAYERLCAAPSDVVREISAYAGLDPDAYAFDLSTIRSRNDKVGDYESDPAWAPALAAMRDAAISKGYVDRPEWMAEG